jgi:ADP-ribose pyrophosphatase YjhB (NUDIX family)
VNFALEPLRVRWEGAELTAIDDPTGQLFCGPNTKVNSLRPPTDFPWTVFVQEKPFVLFVVLDQRREKVLLVKQKRPGDENTIEAPGGAASTLLDGLKNELLQEAGVDLESIEHLAVAAPMAHDVARKLLPDGSPMPVYMVLVQLKKRTRLKAHAFNDNEGVEATQANWYDRDEVMNLIRTGRLYDLPTLSALRLSGLIPTFLVW